MDKNIKVSVIVPVYNAQPFLEECLDSLIRQSLEEIEIICVNDGSTDLSAAILENYRKQYLNITVINQKHSNAGVARNTGLSMARGNYLYFIDADDYVVDEMLEKVYEAAITNKADVVIFGAFEKNEANNTVGYINESLKIANCPENNPFSPVEIKDRLFNSFQNWPWNKLYRREFILQNDISFQSVNRSNDVMFVSLALSLANRIYVLNNGLIYHRVGHGTNMQANNDKEPDSFWIAFMKTYDMLNAVHKENWSLFERSYLNGTLLAFRDYLSTMRSNLRAYNYVSSMIALKGETDFHFLEHDHDDYYDRSLILWYKDLLEQSDKMVVNREVQKIAESKEYKAGKIIMYVPDKIIGVSSSIKDNGIVYTIQRILFHLGIIKDNDPQRTAIKRSKKDL